MNNFFNKKAHSLPFSYINNDNLVIYESEVNSILSNVALNVSRAGLNYLKSLLKLHF